MRNFLAAIFALAFAAAAYSQISSVPQIKSVYESTASADGSWLFVNGVSAQSGKNALYSLNTKTGETFLIFESSFDTHLRFVYGLCFFEKTRTLYFASNCGSSG